jgi:cytochrome c biogenesis protein CcmG, thiol:disulfide interchange protein DsbE
MARVAPFVNGKGWSYEVYCDPNGDFQRAMNVVNPPHTFLIDGKGKIVWQHASYADGDENELYEQIKKLIK